jgi:hypothetical protein
MTIKEDWAFRARTLLQVANDLDKQAISLINEAIRYRGLAEQSDFLAHQENGKPRQFWRLGCERGGNRSED